MFNEFKQGERVIVCGIGKNNEKIYINKTAKILEKDDYYKDYHVKFVDGTDDWLESQYIRKLKRNRKRRKEI